MKTRFNFDGLTGVMLNTPAPRQPIFLGRAKRGNRKHRTRWDYRR